jgi:hypothetical protein
MQQSRDERSLGELFSELTRQTSTLIRQEVALARTEMSDKVSKAGRDVGALAVGGAVAYAGFLAIVGAAIILLAELIPWWLAALVIGLLVALAGYLLIQRGLTSLKQEGLKPERTIETLRDDAEWAKRQV